MLNRTVTITQHFGQPPSGTLWLHQVQFSRLSGLHFLGSLTVGLCLLWEGMAGRTWTLLSGSPFSAGRKEHRD